MAVLCGGVTVLLMAAGQPAGAAAAPARYQVRRGDSLSAIAARLGVSARSLAVANSLADPNLLFAGSWLQLPSGASAASTGVGNASGPLTHVVGAGETLSSIASRYGLAASALAKANDLRNPDVVYLGSKLRIPVVSATDSSGSVADGGVVVVVVEPGRLPSRLRNSQSRMALMPAFDRWSAAYGVPPDLVKAITWLESGWQSQVASSSGAIGIGQLMPITVTTVNRLLGTDLSPWKAQENIRMTARYVAMLLSATGGNTSKALAGYYQGLASVKRDGMYSSTLAYVDGVLALRARFR